MYKIIRSNLAKNWFNKDRLLILYRFIKNVKKHKQKIISVKTKQNTLELKKEECNSTFNNFNWKSWEGSDTFYNHHSNMTFFDAKLLRRSLKFCKYSIKKFRFSYKAKKYLTRIWRFASQWTIFEKGECLWLNMAVGRDTSIIHEVELNFGTDIAKYNLGYGLLNKLIWTLNVRESKLDFLVDKLENSPFKFSLYDENFIDSLLDNYFDSTRVPKKIRRVFKARVSVKLLLKAVIYGLHCQTRIYTLWFTKPRAWYKPLDWREKKYLTELYFFSLHSFRLSFVTKRWFNLLQFRKFSKSRVRKFWKARNKLRFSKVIKLYGAKLFENFLKKFAGMKALKHFYNRIQRMLFCYAVACSGYKKSTLFDFAFFKVLYKAFCTKNLSLIKKYFVLRSKAAGKLLLRANMRHFFIFRLFWRNNAFNYKQNWKAKSVLFDRGLKKQASRTLGTLVLQYFLLNYLRPMLMIIHKRVYEASEVNFKQETYFNFLLITNDEINATFISRYIAKKLTYHHRLKALLNPLKREFRLLGIISNFDKSSLKKKIAKKLSKTASFFKHAWHLFLLLLISHHERILKKYFNVSGLFYSLDFFVIIASLGVNPKKISYYYEKKKSYLCQKMFQNRVLFIFFFIQYAYEISTSVNVLNSMYWWENFIIKWKHVSSFMMYDFFTSKFNLLKNNLSFLDPYFRSIKFSLFQFRRFLHLNYDMISYATMTNHNESSFLKERNKYRLSSIYRGFKIKCVGRFTRKQRATSYWVSLGSVPLNSVDACIDYDSHTLPLANSAITIKVWINKAFAEEHKYLLKIA